MRVNLARMHTTQELVILCMPRTHPGLGGMAPDELPVRTNCDKRACVFSVSQCVDNVATCCVSCSVLDRTNWPSVPVLPYVTLCCSVLQCVAVCCSVLQCGLRWI